MQPRSSALHDKMTGKLIAAAIAQYDGGLGTLFVAEPYRRRGLARLVTADCVKRTDVRMLAHVAPDNAESRGLMQKMSWQEADSLVSWLIWLPEGYPPR